MLTTVLAVITAIKAYCEEHDLKVELSDISDIAFAYIRHGIKAAIDVAWEHHCPNLASHLEDILDD